jgi:hypothetical protein
LRLSDLENILRQQHEIRAMMRPRLTAIASAVGRTGAIVRTAARITTRSALGCGASA